MDVEASDAVLSGLLWPWRSPDPGAALVLAFDPRIHLLTEEAAFAPVLIGGGTTPMLALIAEVCVGDCARLRAEDSCCCCCCCCCCLALAAAALRAAFEPRIEGPSRSCRNAQLSPRLHPPGVLK